LAGTTAAGVRLAATDRLGDDLPNLGKPMRRYAVVRVAWDDEAKVWYVEESDISGLAAEADSVEELRRKVPVIIQDLLEDETDRPDEIEIDFIAYAHDRVRIAA
jgi:predicted RNase H-like HicB family nuclease